MSSSASDRSGLRLALAGGGTGGHVVPGLHLLEGLGELGVRVEHVVWFGAGRSIEARVLQRSAELLPGVPLERCRLRLEPSGGGAPARAGLALRLPAAVWRARRELARSGSQVVVGLGGFVSAPVVLAARLRRTPSVLLEVNAVAGAATRRLAGWADCVAHASALTLPSADAADAPAGRHRVTGPPLGPRFRPRESDPAERESVLRAIGLDPARPLLCFLGGSQGARGINAFAARFAPRLAEAGFGVLHQTGPGRLAEGAAPLAGRVQAVEFLDDVPAVLRACRLVVARGGASTLAELAALRVPTVVVPYPHHRDQHQLANARALGAGVLVLPESELGAAAAEALVALGSDAGRARREALSAALAAAEDGRGAERLARIVAELAGLAVPGAAPLPAAAGSPARTALEPQRLLAAEREEAWAHGA